MELEFIGVQPVFGWCLRCFYFFARPLWRENVSALKRLAEVLSRLTVEESALVFGGRHGITISRRGEMA